MTQWQPKDVIALVALCFTGAMQLIGYNHWMTIVFSGIIGAYVGLDVAVTRRPRRRQ